MTNWVGPYIVKRKEDDLLKYLLHARNADEHTATEIVCNHGPAIGFSFMSNDFEAKVIRPHVRLLPVTDRGSQYPVPRTHLGAPIEPYYIVTMAKLGLQFYSEFLAEAERTFVTQ